MGYCFWCGAWADLTHAICPRCYATWTRDYRKRNPVVNIWDCFLFRDELDVLECRLVQMEDWPVYRHVLVEARVDHQGHPKPLVYAENAERFARWSDRIVHVIADELPQMTGASPLDREAAQREATRAGLGGASADDWLILADVDEIPNETALHAAQARRTCVLEMTCCLFAVDWLWGLPLRTSVLCQAGVGSLAAARRDGWSSNPVVSTAGYHLSWLGGRDSIAAKTAAHCHTECNPDLDAGYEDDRFYHDGVNPFARFGWHSGSLIPVDVDERWPRWVREGRCPPGWFRPRARIPG